MAFGGRIVKTLSGAMRDGLDFISNRFEKNNFHFIYGKAVPSDVSPIFFIFQFNPV